MILDSQQLLLPLLIVILEGAKDWLGWINEHWLYHHSQKGTGYNQEAINLSAYGITIVEGNLGEGYLGNRKRPGGEKQYFSRRRCQ
jgi:hypothetical protein